MATAFQIPGFEQIESAHPVVAKFGHRTPAITCESLNEISRLKLFFKCENFQKTGAFKFRGAINAVSQLTDAQKANGVVTHSSGNHAAALTKAASLFDIPAYIVMPSNSSKFKMSAVESYGGQITVCEPNDESRRSTADAIAQNTGATLIPPFDHPHIIAGQGTCAKELLEDVPDLDVIITPIGGGGLMSGTCIAARTMKPDIKIIGGEPEGADDAYRSLKSGERKANETVNTIADGLRTSLGELTWPVVRDYVNEIVTVTDDEIRALMKEFFERTKLLIEPSCTVAVAPALYRKSDLLTDGMRVGVIITGGNVDLLDMPI